MYDREITLAQADYFSVMRNWMFSYRRRMQSAAVHYRTSKELMEEMKAGLNYAKFSAWFDEIYRAMEYYRQALDCKEGAIAYQVYMRTHCRGDWYIYCGYAPGEFIPVKETLIEYSKRL